MKRGGINQTITLMWQLITGSERECITKEDRHGGPQARFRLGSIVRKL